MGSITPKARPAFRRRAFVSGRTPLGVLVCAEERGDLLESGLVGDRLRAEVARHLAAVAGGDRLDARLVFDGERLAAQDRLGDTRAVDRVARHETHLVLVARGAGVLLVLGLQVEEDDHRLVTGERAVIEERLAGRLGDEGVEVRRGGHVAGSLVDVVDRCETLGLARQAPRCCVTWYRLQAQISGRLLHFETASSLAP